MGEKKRDQVTFHSLNNIADIFLRAHVRVGWKIVYLQNFTGKREDENPNHLKNGCKNPERVSALSCKRSILEDILSFFPSVSTPATYCEAVVIAVNSRMKQHNFMHVIPFELSGLYKI